MIEYRLLTIKEFADRVGTVPYRVRYLIKRGELPVLKRKNRMYVNEEHVKRFTIGIEPSTEFAYIVEP